MRDLHARDSECICAKCGAWHHPRKPCDVEDDAGDDLSALGGIISGQDAERLRRAAVEQDERERWRNRRQDGDD